MKHAVTHEDGGTDEINVTGLSGLLDDLQNPLDHTHQSSGSGVGGKLDHGLALNGLNDVEDHPGYILLTGARDFIGHQSHGGFNIENVADISLSTITPIAQDIIVDLGTDPGDDFIIGTSGILVVEGDNERVGILTSTPATELDVNGKGLFNELEVESTDGLVIPVSNTYAFSRKNDPDTGLYFNVSGPWFEFHRDGNIVAKIKAVTDQGDIISNRNIIVGVGAAGVDYHIAFDGETNDGVIRWKEDEDYFLFLDDILMQTTEKIYFRDTAVSISSVNDGHLDLTADISIDLNGSVVINTTRITSGDSPYTIIATDHIVYADTDGGIITVNLPVGVDGARYKIINTGSSGNNLTITPNGLELLNGVNASEVLVDSENLILTYETTEGWW
jgi:hypothetical protein